MGRVDCSLTLNYVKERERMCRFMAREHPLACDDCPLIETPDCAVVSEITQECIDIVQKWSDEHPQKTMLNRFFELFPNGRKDIDGLPEICPIDLGWVTECKESAMCSSCWNKPYTEVQK